MTNVPIITAHNVSAKFGKHTIWSDASFTVHSGEFVALLGPNGAGKTTLMRTLLGLMPVSGGELRMFGEPPRRGNKRVSYVPQRHPIDTEIHIEALEFVRLGFANAWGFSLPKTTQKERAQALAALKMVDAQSLAHRPLGALSGGELQRVFLAQALLGKPDILLLDEPLANLDIRRETQLVQLVNQVARTQNVAVILIAHNINPLLPVVDRILYVVNGKVASGTPGEIINTKTLSKLYDAPIEVLHDSHGRLAVLGSEEAIHHHE
ncbi:MAG TPA: ABC transporter ATP-binding protein [Candidatus Saccharimonadales bacterium]|nr:ABC transporter ATP-binding protein [Candidatus Saccharimonadales bacterium]